MIVEIIQSALLLLVFIAAVLLFVVLYGYDTIEIDSIRPYLIFDEYRDTGFVFSTVLLFVGVSLDYDTIILDVLTTLGFIGTTIISISLILNDKEHIKNYIERNVIAICSGIILYGVLDIGFPQVIDRGSLAEHAISALLANLVLYIIFSTTVLLLLYTYNFAEWIVNIK